MVRAYLRQHHVGLIALLLVLVSGGSAFAAATIGPGDIQKNAVRSRHIKDGIVTGADTNEATLDVSRVVNRIRGTAHQDLTASPANYPLTQGTMWTQAANESVFAFVAEVVFDKQGCAASGPLQIGVSLEVDNQTIEDALIPIGAAATTTTHASLLNLPLGQPGVPMIPSVEVEVFQSLTCSSGGPVELQELAVDLIGAR